MDYSLLINFGLALLFGAAVGLERENGGQNSTVSPGGIRTYSLIALLGALCGVFYINNFDVFAILIATIFFLILLSYYILNSINSKTMGLTTELAIFFTFLIGLLPMLNILPLKITVTLFVILVLILSIKEKTKKLVAGISAQEIESFVSYLIIALVVLPFLPNVGYTLTDIPFLKTLFDSYNINPGEFVTLELINPQKIWMIVALITGIDVIGYVMAKIIGNKGSFVLSSIVGGFVSSTSTTVSLAQKSKNVGIVNYLVGSALFANMASFVQITLLIGPLNPGWLIKIIPAILIMIISSFVLAMIFIKKKDGDETGGPENESKEIKIFSLIPALKFALLLIMVKIVTKSCLILFGNSGFLISSIIASFSGIDAVVVNLADMAGTTLTFKFALITLLTVSATNLISKSAYSYFQGTPKFAYRFFVSILIISVLSIIGIIFV